MNQIKDRALSSQEPTTNIIVLLHSFLRLQGVNFLSHRLWLGTSRDIFKKKVKCHQIQKKLDLVTDTNSPYAQRVVMSSSSSTVDHQMIVFWPSRLTKIYERCPVVTIGMLMALSRLRKYYWLKPCLLRLMDKMWWT
jgi:hypothetical protein